MFYYLNGTVAHVESRIAVIDCGGVGYLCNISDHTRGMLKIGEPAKLYTHLNVREDAFELIGFGDLEEKNCFLLMTGVTGVGIKAALSILSALSPEQFMLAVIGEDEKALTKAVGVGKKLAQRIILELRDKLKKEYTPTGTDLFYTPENVGKDNLAEARMALQALGYSERDASAVLKLIDTDNMTLEEMIRTALKSLSKI